MVQCDSIRSRAPGYPEQGAFPDSVTRVIDDERRQQFMQEGARFESEYFLTLTYLPPLEAEERMKGWMFDGRGPHSVNRTAARVIDRFSSRVDVFENVFGQLFQTERLKRVSFADDRYHGLHPDWAEMAEQQIANLRVPGHGLDDPVLQDLILELCEVSERFRTIWARHDVKVRADHVGTLLHPLVGPLQLRCEWLAIAASPGMSLTIYHADPGSASEVALRRLAEMTKGAEPVRIPRHRSLPARDEAPSDASKEVPGL